MKEEFTDEFMQASGEYYWLLDRGYPQKGSLKMVGDKFMLSGSMRQVLYRGISAGDCALERRKRIGVIMPGDIVLVDTYNVLFTVNNYLLGKPVFICNDGMMRDAGEMRGRIIKKPVFQRSVKLFLELLREFQASRFILYLDEPVPHSGKLSADLNREMKHLKIDGKAHTVKSPDYMLKHESADALCTSDSVIMDHSSGRIIDVPRNLLEKNFNTVFPVLKV